MTKEEVLEFFYRNNMNLGIRQIAMVMLAAIIVATIISVVYWLSFKGVAYNEQFNVSLVIILLISAVIMMMISSNIVISLGMVGALSIVRFRTAIKDSRDTIFIFWAVVEGLCVGSQNNKLAFESTIIIALVILVAMYIPKMKSYVIVIRGTGSVDVESIAARIKKEGIKKVQMRSVDINEGKWTIIFEVGSKKSEKIVEVLNDDPTIVQVNIVSNPD